MDNSYGKVKWKITSIRNAFLLGLGLLLMCQTSLSAQITAAVFSSPSAQDRKVIMIKKKSLVPAIRQETITGTVTDASTGNTLPGVNIRVKGTSTGTSTGSDGQYELTVESLQDTLVFSFVGYQSRTVPINGRTNINVAMNAETSTLDEMVVVGFGEQSRRNIVGSVASVDSSQVTSVSVNTVDEALQGKVSGVQVTSTSGVLGAPVSVRIRGTSSITSSSQPLYVVDGVPLVSNELGANLGVPGDGGVNPLINLDPNIVKSIEILKDASAAAVYGARGANGVVLITTKDGQAGKSRINIGVSTGFSEPTKRYDMLTGPEFARMYNYRAGEKVFGNTYVEPDQVPNTDWLDIVTRTGSIQNYNASVSGGDQNTQYFISGSFNNKKGYVQPNRLQKYNATAKVHHDFNDKLNLGLKISPSRSVNNRINTSNSISSPYSLGPLTAPVVPQYYPNDQINDGQNTSEAPTNAFANFAGTPYGNMIGNDLVSTVTELNTNAQVQYDFMPQLSLKTQFSTQFLQTEEEFKNADYTTGGYPNGSGSASNEQFLNYSWRNTLTYTSDWHNNSLTALVGVTFQKNDQTQIYVNGNSFLSNQLLNLNSASSITGGGGLGSSYAFQNNVGRITYSYKDRYLLTLTGSLNGSSRFGKKNRYGFFPSVAGGWIISDEAFAQTQALSFLKLRASYGVTGNANIDNFVTLPLLSTASNYAGQSGSVLAQLSKPSLSWETTKQLDISLQYGFINNRIEGSIGYFRKDTDDLLLPVSVSATNGFSSILQNAGSLKNSGFEFNVNANILTAPFSWGINVNISKLNNEVTSLPKEIGNNRIIFGHFADQVAQVGQPVGAYLTREYKGVDPSNGDALYADGKGGTTSDYNAAPRKIVGNPNPDFTGGFGTYIAFKGFEGSINFQFSQGNDIYWAAGGFIRTNLSSSFNQAHDQLDYWTPDNTDASVPEPRPGGNGNLQSSRYIYDGSYLRLKNATIGYTIPPNLINGYKLKIYAQGSNLLTLTDYRGIDPEVTNTAGATVTQGTAFFHLPQSRAVIFGIKIGI